MHNQWKIEGHFPLKGTVRIWVFLMPSLWERNTNTQTVTFCAFVCICSLCVCALTYSYLRSCVFASAAPRQTVWLLFCMWIRAGEERKALLDWVSRVVGRAGWRLGEQLASLHWLDLVKTSLRVRHLKVPPTTLFRQQNGYRVAWKWIEDITNKLYWVQLVLSEHQLTTSFKATKKVKCVQLKAYLD